MALVKVRCVFCPVCGGVFAASMFPVDDESQASFDDYARRGYVLEDLSGPVTINCACKSDALINALNAATAREQVLREALETIADGPEDMDAHRFGVRCGVEDRDLQGYVYAAAEYGLEKGLEYCGSIARAALEVR